MLQKINNDKLETYGQLSFDFEEQNKERLSYTWGSTGFDTLTKWIIKDVLPANSFGICSGPPAGFKTFWAAELAYMISTGLPFLGYTTYQGPVVYIAAEGQAGIKKRIKALEITNNITADNLAIVEVPVFVSRAEEKQKITNLVNEIEQEKGNKVALIIIDTLARCFDGDENTPRDMGNFIESCDQIKNTTGATILCIHHTGKDDSKGARGHSSLKGACDFEYFIKRKAGELSYTLKNSKQKDSEEIADTVVDLDVVDLQFTCDEGKPITSLARTVPPTSSDSNERYKQCPYYQLLLKIGRSCTRLELRDQVKVTISPTFDGAARKRMSTAISRLVELSLVSVNKCSSKTDEDVLALVS